MSICDNENSQAAASSVEQDVSSPSDARMFMRGTGTLFQAAGFMMLFGACCVWVISGFLLKPVSDPPQQWRSYLASEHLPTSLLAIGILASFVGGLGLSAAGIGLQGERPTSGKAALIVCSCLSFVFWAIAFCLIVFAKQWIGGALASFFGVLSIILFLFARRCAGDIKRNPPPQNSVVTEEFLENYRQERAERLSKFNP